jgi:hypothetical protein
MKRSVRQSPPEPGGDGPEVDSGDEVQVAGDEAVDGGKTIDRPAGGLAFTAIGALVWRQRRSWRTIAT